MRSGIADIVAQLEEIPVGLHHRTRRGVEGLKEAVVELDRRVGVIVVGNPGVERWILSDDSKHQPRRDGARVGAHHIALPVDVFDAERRIDGSLVRIRGGTAQIVEMKRAKN